MKHFAMVGLAVVAYVCSARSLMGHYYAAVGATPALAQAEALTNCQAHHFRCHATGCKLSVSPYPGYVPSPASTK